MAGVYGEINNRADFEMALDSAIREAKAILAGGSDDVVAAILKQLEAVSNWTSNGQTPTKDQRASIDFGMRASREYEGDRDKYAWTRKLYGLDAYVADWPSDERAANATDDDFWDDDEDDDDEDDDQD